MNAPDDSIRRIAAELLVEMPHVAKVSNYKTIDTTCWLLAQTAGGTEVLEHQLAVNQIMQEMVIGDIAKVRTDYQFRQQSHDPSSDTFSDATLALQVIDDYATKASMIMSRRRVVIQEALDVARSNQTCTIVRGGG